MALAKDTRLKQLMVYRLEEQLRVISQDDVYSQILASLSRCVQSLLVPKNEKGHDGSGDATTIDHHAKLENLLLGAPRSQDTPSKYKLLELLADSLSVVFSTMDNLKPGPVSRTYLDSLIVEVENFLRAQASSNAHNVTQFTDSTSTVSRPDTVSGVNSSVSVSAMSSTFTAPVVTMALAKDTRLKQLMVYRLEEQLRVISQDDVYSQILASLSRCVQSLLVPKNEKGHDGSGDATTIDHFAKLNNLLLGAPRSQDSPSKDKLLVLLAVSLSVVFSTMDNLKPGPVSRTYLDSVVEEELALTEKCLRAQVLSNASNVTQFTDSTSTVSRSDTVSGVNSSVSVSAMSSTFTAPDAKHDMASQYSEAGNCYRKIDYQSAVECLLKAADVYTDLGRFNMAAKVHVTIARLYDLDCPDVEKCILHYQKVADYYKGVQLYWNARKYLVKVAELTAKLAQYEKAAMIFEEIVLFGGENNKDFASTPFFQALICRLNVGLKDTQDALRRYQESWPLFSEMSEYRLIKGIIKAIEANDEELFTKSVASYEEIEKLDYWHKSLLVKVKRSITGGAAGEENEDDMR